MEKYSRGRRGAPAKGVGRVTGAKVQILSSPPKMLNAQSGVEHFSFGGEERIFSLCVVAHKVCGGADNTAKASRKARFPARQAKLLRERCNEVATMHEVPKLSALRLARSKVQKCKFSQLAQYP